MQTIIVVPCHNEAQRLNAAEFQRFVAQHRHVRFLFVDDGSSDQTATLLAQLARADASRFGMLHLSQNCGKAEAIRQGVLQAATQIPDYIGYWDADLATPLSEIPHFVDVLDRRNEIAIVMGSRIPLLGHEIRRRKVRRLLGKLFARVTSAVLGIRILDTQCGAKLFRANPGMLAAFSQPFGSRWIFDVELLARISRLDTLRHCVYEHPLDHWHDVGGSKLRRGDFFKAVAELCGIWWRYLRPGAAGFNCAPMPTAGSETMPVEPRRAA